LTSPKPLLVLFQASPKPLHKPLQTAVQRPLQKASPGKCQASISRGARLARSEERGRRRAGERVPSDHKRPSPLAEAVGQGGGPRSRRRGFPAAGRRARSWCSGAGSAPGSWPGCARAAGPLVRLTLLRAACKDSGRCGAFLRRQVLVCARILCPDGTGR
jgi:hypothetical protein